jgi:hypothetical protein
MYSTSHQCLASNESKLVWIRRLVPDTLTKPLPATGMRDLRTSLPVVGVLRKATLRWALSDERLRQDNYRQMPN